PGHAAWPPGSLPGDPSADAAQARVLDRIGAGESLVVEGPPGTGKTRLVSTLARAAARGGRSVLVVSDTLAALESIERQIAEARDCPPPQRLY
ncbi:AAA family ATPase, partial [Acinetobacter baumannii]